MKKSNVLTGLLFIIVCTSLPREVTATDYEGIAVDDIFVWELNNGDFLEYIKYEITDITEEMGNVSVTADLTVYDVYIDLYSNMPGSQFTFFYPELVMENLSILGTGVTNETKIYGGLERDCRVVTGVIGYIGAITIDAAKGIILDMTLSSVGTIKLVAWEDQDLLAEYKAKPGIPGYELFIFGICAFIPIVYYIQKYRK